MESKNLIENTKYDLCVIGSGPAGIILALEYCKLNPDKKAILVEFGRNGKNQKNSLDDSIEIENLINHHTPYECTNKGLGGSSATWGGRCVMYDEVDFIDRPIVNNGCTWDIDLFEDVNKYVGKTSDYFDCGEPVFDLNQSPEYKSKHIADNFVPGDVTDSVIERWSMPTRFGVKYKGQITNTKNLQLIQGYEARDFSDPDANGTVEKLLLRNIDDKSTIYITASRFAIASGAQESTRLLLRNKNLFKKLQDVPPSLGKYYQGHISGKIATVKFYGNKKNTEYGFIQDKDGIYLRRRFQFSKDYLVKNNLLNTAIWLDNPLYHNPKHKSGPMSFMYMAMITPILGKKLAPPAIAHSITKGKKEKLGAHVSNIVRGLPGSLLIPARIFYKRYMLTRKLPGIFLYSPENRYALHFHAEQIPIAGNSMTLGKDGETLVINYSLTKDDAQSVIAVHKKLDEWLRKCNCGELEYWYPEQELEDKIIGMSKDGLHQSGTTRIANSENDGVVDNNLTVFGTNNISVCSSSVFPTSGQANPTFYLGVFAVRLANFLSKK